MQTVRWICKQCVTYPKNATNMLTCHLHTIPKESIDHTLTVEVSGLADSCIASGSNCCQLLPDKSSSILQTRVSSSSKVSNTLCIGPDECKARILAIAKTSSVVSLPRSRLSKMPASHTLCTLTFRITTITGYQVARKFQLLEGSELHFGHVETVVKL